MTGTWNRCCGFWLEVSHALSRNCMPVHAADSLLQASTGKLLRGNTSSSITCIGKFHYVEALWDCGLSKLWLVPGSVASDVAVPQDLMISGGGVRRGRSSSGRSHFRLRRVGSSRRVSGERRRRR